MPVTSFGLCFPGRLRPSDARRLYYRRMSTICRLPIGRQCRHAPSVRWRFHNPKNRKIAELKGGNPSHAQLYTGQGYSPVDFGWSMRMRRAILGCAIGMILGGAALPAHAADVKPAFSNEV